MLEKLPKEIRNIILDYKYQIIQSEKLKNCLEEIKNIKFEYFFFETVITYPSKTVEYYGGWEFNRYNYKGIYKFWIHKYIGEKDGYSHIQIIKEQVNKPNIISYIEPKEY